MGLIARLPRVGNSQTIAKLLWQCWKHSPEYNRKYSIYKTLCVPCLAYRTNTKMEHCTETSHANTITKICFE